MNPFQYKVLEQVESSKWLWIYFGTSEQTFKGTPTEGSVDSDKLLRI